MMRASLSIALLAAIHLCQPLQDWLIHDVDTPTQLVTTERGTVRLYNGLIYREFAIRPDFATVDYYSYEKQSSLLRALGPEAVITLDDRQYDIGGIITDIPRAYLNRTALALDMAANPNAFHYDGYTTSPPQADIFYKPKRGAPEDIQWPPKGLRLDVSFKAPDNAPDSHQLVQVVMHYEMYDGIPLMSKWLSVRAPAWVMTKVMLAVVMVEYLAVNLPWSPQGLQWMYIEASVPHGINISWLTDPSQQDMPGSFEPLLTCSYELPPKLPLSEFNTSFRVHELVHASSDRERSGLAQRRMLRLLAPWTQENPIFFHMTNASTEAVLGVIDQLAEVGFEMLIYSFGSGLDVESTDERYIEEIASVVRYAYSKGIEVGGYDLIAWSRKVPDYWRVDTGTGYGGVCFASGWYDYLIERLLNFIDKTGLSMLETDGPYPGYSCHSSNHTHHHGYQDSVYKQLQLQGRFYSILQQRGVYTNQPDKYFYSGGSKDKMPYSEKQYSLPRWQDLSVRRQDMYDSTYHYTPTSGWMFVPLVVYHGGGDEAMFEPLSQHLQEYEWALAQYLGAGVAACYRGYRIYDNNNTKAVVSKWVSFYKKYRAILTSDVIHVRRPDIQSVDCYMHVNPRLTTRALAMVFNPTNERIQTNMTLPLYYTGLSTVARLSEQAGHTRSVPLDRGYNIDLYIDLPPLGITWFLIE